MAAKDALLGRPKHVTMSKKPKAVHYSGGLLRGTSKTRKAIAAKGGRKSQRTGKGHSWKTSDQARRAGLQKAKFFGRVYFDPQVPSKNLITVREAVEFSGLSTRTINNCLKDGRLKSRKKGSRRFVTTTSVVALRLEYQKLL